MADFFAAFDSILAGLWNYLYKLICEALGEEINEDFYVDSLLPKAED